LRRPLVKEPAVLISVGMICLAVAILLKHVAGSSGPVAFVEGLLTGLSLVFNVAYLWIVRRRRPPG
jgi:hypothetical protein